jgi:hypothetical protein
MDWKGLVNIEIIAMILNMMGLSILTKANKTSGLSWSPLTQPTIIKNIPQTFNIANHKPTGKLLKLMLDLTQ